MLHSSAACLEGSSPHTRGAHRIGCVVSVAVRIIPAYAGSTSGEHLTGRAPADHPRIRGEHPGVNRNGRGPAGSSPHTRGARRHETPESQTPGIIPAYAGSTGRGRVAGGDRWDDPRRRGQNSQAAGAAARALGSSPHTRGALPGPRSSGTTRGIIPAYAGSTRSSPPHPASRAGIIPAYAGSTQVVGPGVGPSPDHPRIRGEHVDGVGVDERLQGSSPHTRGAPRTMMSSQALRRIIPAYAGSTFGRCGRPC